MWCPEGNRKTSWKTVCRKDAGGCDIASMAQNNFPPGRGCPWQLDKLWAESESMLGCTDVMHLRAHCWMAFYSVYPWIRMQWEQVSLFRLTIVIWVMLETGKHASRSQRVERCQARLYRQGRWAGGRRQGQGQRAGWVQTWGQLESTVCPLPGPPRSTFSLGHWNKRCLLSQLDLAACWKKGMRFSKKFLHKLIIPVRPVLWFQALYSSDTAERYGQNLKYSELSTLQLDSMISNVENNKEGSWRWIFSIFVYLVEDHLDMRVYNVALWLQEK